MPLVLPLHGGTHLGDGLAYTFCEVPTRGHLYADIPGCDSIWTDYEHRGGGSVAEYDLATMTLIAMHRFFSPDYYGRMEKLACLPDQVLLIIHGTVFDGHPPVESVLAFRPESPESFDPRSPQYESPTLPTDGRCNLAAPSRRPATWTIVGCGFYFIGHGRAR